MDDLTTKELAIHHFQDKLSKFCPADKNRPNGYEIAMFEAGYAYCDIKLTKAEEKIEELQAENAHLREMVANLEKDEKMFLNEHNENVRLHFENVDLKEQNAQLIDALSKVQALTFSFVMNKDNAADILLIVKPIRDVIKQTLERNKL